jgi:hypothetical protein
VGSITISPFTLLLTKVMTDKKQQQKLILFGAPVSLVASAAYTEVASAQTASTSITQMQTDATAIQSMTSVLIPIAVGSIVFGAAALLFKRYIYS